MDRVRTCSLPTFALLCLAWTFNSIAAALLYDDFIVTTDSARGTIYQMSLDGTLVMSLNVSAEPSPLALTYVPETQTVYWTDLTEHTLLACRLDGGDRREILSLASTSSLEGLAVDHTAGLIFYSDLGLRLISVMKLDGTDRRTLVTTVEKPRSIALDPNQRQFYWSDWGKNTIERMNYDGTGRQVIHKTNQSSWLNSVALDLRTRRVYWLDAQRHVVQSARMDDGSDVRTVLDAMVSWPDGYNGTTNAHLYGLALDDERIYITDWERSGLFSARKSDGADFKLLNADFVVPGNVAVYKSSLHVTGHTSGCQDKNGGCSNLCIPTADGYTCACPDRQKLGPTGKNCLSDVVAVGPDLIWVEHDSLQTSHIMGSHGDPDTYLSARRMGTRWTVRSPNWHWTAVGNDYGKDLLYLADREDGLIVSLALNRNISIEILHYGTSSEINGIAVDWVAGNLYWTDALFNWIMLAKTDRRNSVTKTLLSTGMDKPHGIAVWPQKGLLLWTDWGIVSKIEVATLAGKERRALVTSGLNKPSGITIDTDNERIFWCNEDSIEYIRVDGTERTLIGSYPMLSLAAITFYDHFVFATDQGKAGETKKLVIMNVDNPRQPYPRLLLNRQPYGITMYSQEKQQYNSTACPTLGCDQLCVSAAADSAECLCGDGYDLGPDGKTCSFNSQRFAGPSIVYALDDRLCAVSTQIALITVDDPDSGCFFVDGRYSFRALDYHYASGYLYFSEVKQRVRSIRRAHMRNMTDNQAIVSGTGEVRGIAVDWTAGNLYWTDFTRGQIWVSRLDGTLQKTLVSGLVGPHGIAIDQEMKKFYWSEQGIWTDDETPTLGRLQRANMDGTNVITLHRLDVKQPAGLSMDPISRSLSWVDLQTNSIQRVNVDGLDDQSTVEPSSGGTIEGTLYDVAAFQDFLMFSTSQLNNQSGAQLMERESGKLISTRLLHTQHPNAYDIVVFAEQNQASLFIGNSSNSCTYDNGGCEQLCLQRPNGKTCSCVDGMEPSAEDASKCVPVNQLEDHFFLLADDYRGQIYQLNVSLGTSPVSSFLLPPGERPIALAYDFDEDRVYWTDFSSGVIKRAHLNGSDVMTVLQAPPGSRIDGLSYDQESKILYYTDAGRGQIGVVSPSGSYHTVIVKENLSSPRAIVVDPKEGYMYYTVRNTSRGRIERRDLTGDNLVVLVNTELSWPNGLSVSFEDGKLYWIDAHSEKIEASNLDGSGRRLVLADDRESDPFAIAVQGGDVYWTDWMYSGVYRLSEEGNTTVHHDDLFRGLNDLKFFNKTARRGPNVCSGAYNGGCSHFCLSSPSGRRCACPIGKQLGEDQATCEDAPTCPEEIPNGVLENSCSRMINDHCGFYCQEGFTATTIDKIQCVQGLAWDRDITKLCLESVCPALPNPEHTYVDDDCPLVGYPDITCIHRCNEGYTPIGGSSRRYCNDDLEWTGSNLICTRVMCPSLSSTPELKSTVGPSNCVTSLGGLFPGHVCQQRCFGDYSHVLEGTTVRVCQNNGSWSGQPLVCGKPESTTTPTTKTTSVMPVTATRSAVGMPTIIGIAVACGGLLGIIVLVAILVARRQSKRAARYRNTSNIQDTDTQIHEIRENMTAAQTNNNPKDFHYGVANGHVPSPTYDVISEKVDLDGKLGADFSRNGVTTVDTSGEKPTTKERQPSGKNANGVAGNKGKTATDQTSFSNPMYTKEKQQAEERARIDRELKGENVNPDLTVELSSI